MSTIHYRNGYVFFGLMSVPLNEALANGVSTPLHLGIDKLSSVTFVVYRQKESKLSKCFGLLSRALRAVRA